MKVISDSDLNLIKNKLKSTNIDLDELRDRLTTFKKIIVICGPTCTGKSRTGIILAKLLDTDIISADSMQVYRGMDIGTDKYKSERYGVKQYMTDMFEPDYNFSAVEFRNICSEIIKNQFFNKKKVPLLIGGSGLYIRGTIENMDPVPQRNEIIRKRLKEEMEKDGVSEFYLKLKKIDKDYASRISENDRRRIIRALEVYEITGRPFSDFQNAWKNRKYRYNSVIIGFEMKRSDLYKRIEERVDRMFEINMVDEVRNMVKKGYGQCNSIMQAVGYKEVIKYLNGEINLNCCIDLVKRNTRRLAKKQMTWFRAEPAINWIRVNNYDNIFNLTLDILKILGQDAADEKN